MIIILKLNTILIPSLETSNGTLCFLHSYTLLLLSNILFIQKLYTIECIVIIYKQSMSIFRALLSCNSHTIQYTRLKYKIQWILICPQSSAAITTINFKTFLLPPQKPCISSHSPITSHIALSQALGSHESTFWLIELFIMATSYKWNYIVCGLL